MSRLFIQVRTQSGARTIITNDLTQTDASEIAHALATIGLSSFVHEDVAPVDIKAILKRRKAADAKAAAKAAKPLPANVTKLKARA